MPSRSPGDDREAFGLFALGVAEVGVTVETEQRRDLRIRPARQQRQPPSEERRGKPQRADRVAEVVLAVPKGALAVLPRLPPVDRGQPDEKRVSGHLNRIPACVAAKTARSSSACSRGA